MGEISLVYPDDMPLGDRRRSYALEWIENVAEVDPDPVVLTNYIVRYVGTNFFVVFFTFSWGFYIFTIIKIGAHPIITLRMALTALAHERSLSF